jgi:hypothetical protein
MMDLPGSRLHLTRRAAEATDRAPNAQRLPSVWRQQVAFPSRRSIIRPAVWPAAILSVLVAACSPAPTPTPMPTAALPAPSGSAQAGAPGWFASRVEQPAAIEALPTDVPSMCNPCHPILGTYINSVVALGTEMLAVGQDLPPAHAAAWTSTDGKLWRRVTTLPAPSGSNINAALVTGTGGEARVVAVGADGGIAAVWHTADADTWTMEQLAAPPGTGTVEQLQAVAQTPGGFVAGGFVQDPQGRRMATLWQSADGRTWTRATLQTASGESEVTGVAAVPGGKGIVAVGISGDERRGTAAAWLSSDGGATWQSISSPALGSGRMLAIAAGSAGVCAVGETQDQTAAAAWTSVDGSSWIADSSQPGLANGGMQMVMESIGWDGSNFYADGWRTDAGNGSAVVWRSSDCKTWTHLPQDVTFSGAGMAAIMVKPRLIAAGTMGWPDTHAAQVWLPPSG